MDRVGRAFFFLKRRIARLNPMVDLSALEHPAATDFVSRKPDLIDPFVYRFIAYIEILADLIDGEPLVVHKIYPLRQ
jgi:hypothetical protein